MVEGLPVDLVQGPLCLVRFASVQQPSSYIGSARWLGVNGRGTYETLG